MDDEEEDFFRGYSKKCRSNYNIAWIGPYSVVYKVGVPRGCRDHSDLKNLSAAFLKGSRIVDSRLSETVLYRGLSLSIAGRKERSMLSQVGLCIVDDCEVLLGCLFSPQKLLLTPMHNRNPFLVIIDARKLLDSCSQIHLSTEYQPKRGTASEENVVTLVRVL